MFEPMLALKNGDEVQRQVYQSIKASDILTILKNHSPLVVGTFPIGIYIESSDIDIICQADDFDSFERLVKTHFAIKRVKKSEKVMVINFFNGGFEYELYVTHQSSHLGNGYRHMIIEAEILAKENKSFKEEIIALKKAGMKTEPAFAKLLGLTGNPYQALLNYNP